MKYILTFINTIIFFFVTDLILSNFIKDTKITTIEKNDSYDYSFVPNLNTKDRYGHLTFNLCTDYNSFRINCSDKNKKIKNKKNFDLIVIGDSFVEGIGLDHKDTFIGKLQISYPNLVIGNAGVRGYSTKNYLNKIKFLIDQNYVIKRLVVFIDISDLEDKKDELKIETNSKKNERKEIIDIKKTKEIIKKNFKYTYFLYFKLKQIYEKKILLNNKSFIKNLKKNIPAYNKNYYRSSWTYDNNNTLNSLNLFKKLESDLNKLFILCKENEIFCSIAVYPWPNQILYDEKKSKHTEFWKDFCLQRCEKYLNIFPFFFRYLEKDNPMEVVMENYIYKDVHFNENGHKKIFDFFRSTFFND